MKRGTSLVWVGLMVAVAVGTYVMKDRAARAADYVATLRADIAGEKEAMVVLRAEWSVLDQPGRLQSLVQRYSGYLQLQSLDVRQLATIRDVPEKPPLGSDAVLDAMRTGSVAKTASSAHPGSSSGTSANAEKPARTASTQPLPIRSPRPPSASAPLGE